MNRKRNEKLPARLERVKADLEEWRSKKQSQGERIPERLWQSAAKLGRKYGIHQVSSTLGLDYSHLKRRAYNGNGEKKQVDAEAIFVELCSQKTESRTTCLVELEKENGTRMRVCVDNAATVDWCRLKEAFLGA